MANDPVIGSDIIKGSNGVDPSLPRVLNDRDPALQKIDARLREAVASGDENYVRSRLGGDRVLSEAEILLIIKTRQEAQEKVSEQIATIQNAERVERNKVQEEETFTQWARRYVAARNAEQQRTTTTAAGIGSFLDASGRDPYGYKFVANFGTDSQGNYRDSFGGNLGRNDVYRGPSGGDSDLRLGLYTLDKDVFNHQTGQGIIFDEKTGTYLVMNKDAEPMLGPDGKPKRLTQAERDEMLAEWKRTNRRLSDAEMEVVREDMKKTDRRRAALAGNSSDATSAETTAADEAAVPSVLAPATGRADSREQVITPGPAPIPRGNAGIRADEEGFSNIQRMRAAVAELSRPKVREYASRWTEQAHRIDAMRQDSVGAGLVQASSEDKDRLAAAAAAARSDTPQYLTGQGTSGFVPPKGWLKDKDGGIWDDKGGYYDKQGGYWDKQGGYFDKDGNYTDQFGGFKAKDGSYMDAQGNFVDPQGNLWLAGNDSDTPDYPKKAGVNYIDVLAKAAENQYSEMAITNPGLDIGAVKELETRLKAVAAEAERREDAARAARKQEQQLATPEPQKSAFLPTAPASSASEASVEQETPVATQRKVAPAVSLARKT